MIKKSLKHIVTFHTTSAAMEMEDVCREENLNGRLIPLPKRISADCGLAWCSDIKESGSVEKLLEEKGLPFQGIHICEV
ncbi:MAG: DUF3343 domain-containing protein [Anaerovoracaceae bacterium]|nr:DUF3343 domain-containing protein [Anaerovoracaceae bacterium]